MKNIVNLHHKVFFFYWSCCYKNIKGIIFLGLPWFIICTPIYLKLLLCPFQFIITMILKIFFRIKNILIIVLDYIIHMVDS